MFKIQAYTTAGNYPNERKLDDDYALHANVESAKEFDEFIQKNLHPEVYQVLKVPDEKSICGYSWKSGFLTCRLELDCYNCNHRPGCEANDGMCYHEIEEASH
jgi:hypothetical protein